MIAVVFKPLLGIFYLYLPLYQDILGKLSMNTSRLITHIHLVFIVLILLCFIYLVIWSEIFGHPVFIYSVVRFWSNVSDILHPLRTVSLMNKFTNCSLETCFQQVLLFCNCKFVVNISFEGA